MSVPHDVREEVKAKLWEEADRLGWPTLSSRDKSRYYTVWTETWQLGGKLAAFMDARQVRVYIKDTLLKSYTRERLSDVAQIFRVLDIAPDVSIAARYIKPHGRRLEDGREIAWSASSEWKATLLALHERAFVNGGRPYGAVLYHARAKYSDPERRRVIDDAAEKLRIEQLIYID